MHKWAFTPRGCAIFYANSRVRSQTRSLIVSFNRYDGFELDFYRQGTRDYSSQLCAGAGVDYLYKIGGMVSIFLCVTDTVFVRIRYLIFSE